MHMSKKIHICLGELSKLYQNRSLNTKQLQQLFTMEVKFSKNSYNIQDTGHREKKNDQKTKKRVIRTFKM